MENLKNIQPVEDFNWDAFEQGETYTEVSKDDLVKTKKWLWVPLLL